jgi:hypothetical protein
MNELNFACRQRLKNPGFTYVAVLTLALGIRGSTAVFSLIDRVIPGPLPFPDPDRLVLLWTALADSRASRSAYGTFAQRKGGTMGRQPFRGVVQESQDYSCHEMIS